MANGNTAALARRVLAPAGNEADIRNRICRLLDALGYDEYFLEYRAGRGDADIVLPRQRTIIETKARGRAVPHQAPRAGETPFQQLDRYMQAEIRKERASLFADESERRWIGILTDGLAWHRWSYEHRDNPVAQPEEGIPQPANGANLAQWLDATLDGEPVGKQWIPRNPVALFAGQEAELRGIYDGLAGAVARETATKLALWRDMLRSSGMEPETDPARHTLFVVHSFLIALARGVIWTMAHPREDPEAEELLGGGIVSWVVQTVAGRNWANGLFRMIGAYEWRLRRGDVLRPLYEEFVDAADRRDFGEVYTPDWLAELLVREMLDDTWCDRAIAAARSEIYNREPVRGVGMLDPCCGSGTFLYHAVRRILARPDVAERPEGERADIASRLISGMDIHPVACEFARATLLRALPCDPPAGSSALRVYNGDALLLHGNAEGGLFRPRNGEVVFTSPAGHEIRLPRAFVGHSVFSTLVGEMTDTARDGRELPPHIERSVEAAEDRQQLRDSHAALGRIIADEGNSVWTWYITQMVGPYLLAQHKVDRIVSNPPWVKMSTIQALQRKRRLEGFAGEIDLWQGGRQAANFDIAQLFVKRCRQQYLAAVRTNPAAWVVKHSAIKGGNWERFRDWRREAVAAPDDKQILDLAEAKVFGGGDARKCCVLVDGRRTSLDPAVPILAARCAARRTPDAAAALEEAEDLIQWEPLPAALPEGPSAYEDEFRRGADCFPHVLVQAELIVGQGANRTVTTRRSSRPRWNMVPPQNAAVPARWLTPLLRSDHLLPFALAPGAPVQAIVPLDRQGQLMAAGNARRSPDWARLDDLYRQNRGQGAATPATLLENIDHQGKARRQLPLAAAAPDAPRTRLIYPTSGDIMRAGRIRAGAELVDTTLYDTTFETPEEAGYLVAVLNAPALNPAFVQSRRSGRHFHLNPWRRVPVPRYDHGIALHRELVELSDECETETAAWMAEEAGQLPGSQIGRSKRIREMLQDGGFFGRLNEAVARLLPEQCG